MACVIETFFDILNAGLHGFTLFSPNNTAVDIASVKLHQLVNNVTAVIALVENHVRTKPPIHIHIPVLFSTFDVRRPASCPSLHALTPEHWTPIPER